MCPDAKNVPVPGKEPLIPFSLPEHPWQKVASNLFHLSGDNYSEVTKLQSTTSRMIINSLRSDNGPQFTSNEFKEFAKEYQFTHTTSSPHYPPSNGEVERTVKTVKSLLKNAEDPYIALLSYRATPLPWCGKSPAQLLMGRNI